MLCSARRPRRSARRRPAGNRFAATGRTAAQTARRSHRAAGTRQRGHPAGHGDRGADGRGRPGPSRTRPARPTGRGAPNVLPRGATPRTRPGRPRGRMPRRRRPDVGGRPRRPGRPRLPDGCDRRTRAAGRDAGRLCRTDRGARDGDGRDTHASRTGGGRRRFGVAGRDGVSARSARRPSRSTSGDWRPGTCWAGVPPIWWAGSGDRSTGAGGPQRRPPVRRPRCCCGRRDSSPVVAPLIEIAAPADRSGATRCGVQLVGRRLRLGRVHLGTGGACGARGGRGTRGRCSGRWRSGSVPGRGHQGGGRRTGYRGGPAGRRRRGRTDAGRGWLGSGIGRVLARRHRHGAHPTLGYCAIGAAGCVTRQGLCRGRRDCLPHRRTCAGAGASRRAGRRRIRRGPVDIRQCGPIAGPIPGRAVDRRGCHRRVHGRRSVGGRTHRRVGGRRAHRCRDGRGGTTGLGGPDPGRNGAVPSVRNRTGSSERSTHLVWASRTTRRQSRDRPTGPTTRPERPTGQQK